MTTSYGRLHQLAKSWQARADQDTATARQKYLVGDEFRMLAMARRNCAWELRKLLMEMEKENPAEAGLTSVPQSECKSG